MDHVVGDQAREEMFMLGFMGFVLGKFCYVLGSLKYKKKKLLRRLHALRSDHNSEKDISTC